MSMIKSATESKSNTESRTKNKSTRQMAREEKRCFWHNHIQGWRESGLNQIDYCRRQGLKRDQFTYWKGRLAQDSSSISLAPVAMKVNLQPSSQPITPKPLVVVVDSRFRIEVSGDFESKTLVKLVSALRQV